MALTNYSLPNLGAEVPSYSVTPDTPLRAQFDDLLYSPEDHQEGVQTHNQNEPFTPPNQKRSQLRKRSGMPYLPPQNQYTHYPRNDEMPQNPYGNQMHTQVYQPNSRLNVQIENQRVHEVHQQQHQQYDQGGQYVHDNSGDYDFEQKRLEQSRSDYRMGYQDPPYPAATPAPSYHQQPSRTYDGNRNYFSNVPPTQPPTQRSQVNVRPPPQAPPKQSPGFTKVEAGANGGKTQLHAVLDYDDDYYDDIPAPGQDVTPLQGPILIKNGSVPVVPLTSYPTVNNGSFYQIPILWTALSVALGYEIQGQVIKGIPCVKRNFQLYCPTAGNTYPLKKIETFIDENKALIKRMYGSFSTPAGNRVRRAPGVPDLHAGDSFFRHVRQASNTKLPNSKVNDTGRIDACESRTEITTPYWALNSAKKLRAIVNTMHFEQAIHQEVCSKTSTSRCAGDCGCEQKYKWHRLLAYDPSDDCAGIFMDWFLFPSCCVCRCKPL